MKKLQITIEIPDNGCVGCPHVSHNHDYSTNTTTYWCELFSSEIGKIIDYNVFGGKEVELKRCADCISNEVKEK